MNRLASLLLVVLVAIALPGLAAAQQPVAVAINPSTVTFEPSGDHATTLSDGTPILIRYEMQVFLKGAAAPFQTFDLQKPTPAAGNIITIQNPAWLQLGINKEGFVRIVAIGPGGRGVSDPSNPFATVVAPPAPTAVVVK